VILLLASEPLMMSFFASVPITLAWGWIAYIDILRKSPARLWASLVGLIGATASACLGAGLFVAVWIFHLSTDDRAYKWLVILGGLFPIVCSFVALFGRLRLLAPILLASASLVIAWFSLTLT